MTFLSGAKKSVQLVKFMEKRITMNSVQYTDTLMVGSCTLWPVKRMGYVGME
jgi:hypothetical protein